MKSLRELRLKNYLSQAELAHKAGLATATINRLENGRSKPVFKTIRVLAKALGVEPGEIDF
ncbi:helix-turn-helix domain-containing protein [Chloroflexota bacterium]